MIETRAQPPKSYLELSHRWRYRKYIFRMAAILFLSIQIIPQGSQSGISWILATDMLKYPKHTKNLCLDPNATSSALLPDYCPAGTRHQPPIHRLAGNCKIQVWLPCTPQPLYTESLVFHGKAMQHAVIPVSNFTWPSSTPSTNKISTFNLLMMPQTVLLWSMETNLSGYIPI